MIPATVGTSTSVTKAKILDTAEKLFGDKGFDATSLRDITTEAQVNLAAVNYHFHSKESLIDAVIARRMAPLTRRRRPGSGRSAARSRHGPPPWPTASIRRSAPASRTAPTGPTRGSRASTTSRDASRSRGRWCGSPSTGCAGRARSSRGRGPAASCGRGRPGRAGPAGLCHRRPLGGRTQRGHAPHPGAYRTAPAR